MNETERRALGLAVRTVIDKRFNARAELDGAFREVVADLLQRVEAIEARLGIDVDAPPPRAHNVAPFKPRPRPRTPSR